MISVSDILKLLENIPIWKTLTTLPGRIEALEKRVAQLEGEAGRHVAPDCPRGCGPMAYDRQADTPFTMMSGETLRFYRCDTCGEEQPAIHKP